MRRQLPTLVALGVALLWGLNFLLLKLALGEFRVLSFAFLPFAGMVVLAWAVVLFRWTPIRLEPRDRPRVLVTGLIGYSGYVLLALIGLNFTTAFSNALLIAAAPVFSALLLAAWRVESLGTRRAAGLLVSLVGVGVFMFDTLAAGWGSAGLGDLISLAAAACFAAYTVLMKPLTSRYSAALLSAFTLTVGALPVLLISAPDLGRQDWRLVDASGWSLLAWSTVVPAYLAWTLWSWATSTPAWRPPTPFCTWSRSPADCSRWSSCTSAWAGARGSARLRSCSGLAWSRGSPGGRGPGHLL